MPLICTVNHEGSMTDAISTSESWDDSLAEAPSGKRSGSTPLRVHDPPEQSSRAGGIQGTGHPKTGGDCEAPDGVEITEVSTCHGKGRLVAERIHERPVDGAIFTKVLVPSRAVIATIPSSARAPSRTSASCVIQIRGTEYDPQAPTPRG